MILSYVWIIMLVIGQKRKWCDENVICGYPCSTSDNYQFLKGMRNLVAKSGYKLKICHEYVNRGDRWMQVRKLNV